MDKLRMQSTNGVQENIGKIQSLFPDCVTETIDERTGELVRKVDFEKLQQNLSDVIISGREERYQFTWPDKKKAILLANSPVNAALRPCREESVDFDNTQNLYIEGDNLDVLKCLKETYLHKVKMIYIDPPYNTGNDFVYEDDFAESSAEYLANSGQFDEQGNRLVTNTESNGRFHTDWLNMIYPRLKVARDLLTDDGVIFISIDDNELENLKRVCDEIFGEENRIETIVWKNKYGAGAYTVGFISVHEYILCYSKKKILDITSELDEESQSVYSKRDEKYSIRGGYMTQPLMTNSLGDRPNLMYPIEHNGVVILPRKQWVWSQDRLQTAIDNNEVEFNLQKDGTYSVRSKAYLKDERGKIRRGKPLSLMSGPFNQDGTKEVRRLFDGKSIFDFTKPVSLIQKLLALQINNSPDNDFVVLDFFSGSATTAHAVMQLNAEDGGNRKFIMVQLPELTDEKSEAYKAGYKTICEIGKERIRRAGKKIKEDSPLTTQDLDTGFRVLKLDSTNMEGIYYTPKDISQADIFLLVNNVKSDRTAEDLLFQVMLELGAMLDSKIATEVVAGKTIYNVADGYLVACFDKDVTDEVVTTIAKMHPLYAVLRDTSMANDSTATNFEQLFKTYSPDTVTKIL
ncbi:site-specific DNA-methyltransferase [Phocaeicola sp.]|uniref:site-specific DNA-methyltransferase n=1 Tax=Phocaeicola sp. TaxID=2773926 RepID=UPI0023C94794|nr:site-specific DNA-methyltransferase [Phocaeicola sp.]MDE5678649.1 site-specific DNA-methyltransferase [Phocaeicola sp.]